MKNQFYTNNRYLLTIRYIAIQLLLVTALLSCNYLDIVPDNVQTIEHAFSNSTEAEKYLHSCYTYLPRNGDPGMNVGFFGADEAWLPESRRPSDFDGSAWQIARGYQNVNDPYLNYWDGARNGKPLFEAIRDCNTFLEHVKDESILLDLELDKRMRWIGEATFLKAYYHFLLLTMYGPIPIIDKNTPISATPEQVRVKRMPIDKCVEYIAEQIDVAIPNLPYYVSRPTNELGRITKVIAYSVKAKLYLYAASPLFNGNTDYQNFKNKDGEPLVNTTYDQSKWQRAADAAKMAIQVAEEHGAELYQFKNDSPIAMTEQTITQMSIRNAVCEPWNKELIWGNSESRPVKLQEVCMGLLTNEFSISCMGQMAAPLKIVEMFYTKNGVPITEDRTLDYSDYHKLRLATQEDNVYIKKGMTTARLNFDREPRFYANLSFDAGTWLLFDTPSKSDQDTYVMQSRYGQTGSGQVVGFYSETGYFCKKLVSWESTFKDPIAMKQYPWPEIRLADLYLMYAEALNESKTTPDDDVYKYIDAIRKRAGLKGVVDSWTQHSANPSKVKTKEGMREIIRQERGIELAFEGSRFWDLRRWKTAAQELNKTLLGWDINQKEVDAYYQPRVVYKQKFIAPRDYLWPIKEEELSVNPLLVQNPGW